MSVQAMAWVFEHSPTRLQERLVLLAIANHADADGAAWPSMATLAKEVNAHLDTVKRVVGRLHDEGHITRSVNGATTRRQAPGRQPNHYVVTMDVAEVEMLRKERVGGTERPCNVGSIGGTEDAPNSEEDWGDGASLQPQELGGGSVGNWGEAPSGIGGRLPPREPSVEPSLNHQRANPVRAARRANPFGEDFEEFWKPYPRKLAKDAAKKAYAARRRAGAGAEDILVACQRFAAHCRSTSRPIDRTPHGASWLNNGWEDWLPGGAAEEEARFQGRGFRTTLDNKGNTINLS